MAVVVSEPQPESGLIYKLASKGGRIKKGEKITSKTYNSNLGFESTKRPYKLSPYLYC